MDEDRVKLVHAAVVAMITSPEFVDELVRKTLAVAPAQQATNSAMVPCVHAEIVSRMTRFVADTKGKYDILPLLAFVEWDARHQ